MVEDGAAAAQFGTRWLMIRGAIFCTSAPVMAGPGIATSEVRKAATICSSSSIVAVKPETGKMVWYFQETPGEKWDYTAAQPMILADLLSAAKTQGSVACSEKRFLLCA